MNAPEYLKNFLEFFNPKVEQLKQDLIKKFQNEFDFKFEELDHTSKDVKKNANNLANSINSKLDFNKEYNLLLERCTKEYIDIQLDLYTSNKISKDELEFRISWINKNN